jgi:hypothetical protein
MLNKNKRSSLPPSQSYRRYLEESYTQKRKINATIKILERTNLIR